MISVTLTGSGTWTCPAGVTSIQLEGWGAGGDGGTRTSSGATGGGGGGAYGKKNTYAVTPGNTYAYSCGTASGADTYFVNTSTFLVKGGSNVGTNVTTGGTRGLASACVGTDTAYDGGDGSGSSTNAGGGGESGGPTGAGNAGGVSAGGTGRADAGDGGAGATSNANGNGGSGPGGGGGGARRTSGTRSGGPGAAGQLKISYAPPPLNPVTGGTPIRISASSLAADANLLNYYPLNGDANDAKGSAHGTPVNMQYDANWSPFGGGVLGAFFDNTLNGGVADAYIAAPFYEPGASDFTYYMLVYIDQLPNSGYNGQFLFDGANDATGHPDLAMPYYDAGQIQFYCGSGAGTNGVPFGDTGTAPTSTVVAGKWYQVAFTRSGNVFSAIVDGVTIMTATVSGVSTISGQGRGQLGRRWNDTYPSSQQPFRGYMADAAMFSRALTNAELLYLRGVTNFVPQIISM